MFGQLCGLGLGLAAWQLADIVIRQVHVEGRQNPLAGLAVDRIKHGSQCIVAQRQHAKGLRQHLAVQFADDARPAGNVVGRARWVQLHQEPQTFLAVSQQQPFALFTFGYRRYGCSCALVNLGFDYGGEFSQFRFLEKECGLNRYAELFAQGGNGLDDGDRLAAQGKKALLRRDRGDVQYLAPNHRNTALEIGQFLGSRLFRLALPVPLRRIHIQSTFAPGLITGTALQFTAAGFRQSTRIEQQDQCRRLLAALRQRVVDGIEQIFRRHPFLRATADFGGNTDALAAVDIDRECGDPALAQQFDLFFQGLLNILRIQVLAANQNHVLDASGHEQAAVANKAQIAGAQPGFAVLVNKGFQRRRRILPITVGNAGAAEPDFADTAFVALEPAGEVDNRQLVFRLHSPAIDDDAAAFGQFGAMFGQRVGGVNHGMRTLTG